MATYAVRDDHGKPEYMKWGAVMAWILNQQHFRENVLKLGLGGGTGPVNDLLRRTERTGAPLVAAVQ